MKTSDANAEALRRIQAAKATLVGLTTARDVVPGLRDRLVLHAGPPVPWERMCGPMRGAGIGATLFEGWARTPEGAGRPPPAGSTPVASWPPPPPGGPEGRNHTPPQAVG